ncbi:hypothetical protein [Paenibacillus agilis]|uniref:Uncharacterized protein n=1 Tax=Paenibacillus agilis TaxID=3020863 RepID=A0A559IDL5_9BACL|nr:hypothetical protein [Paenibacillus agilis]TVX85543.1 hypothetical protein FPZ44_24615 [Paenibacillus agilis]
MVNMHEILNSLSKTYQDVVLIRENNEYWFFNGVDAKYAEQVKLKLSKETFQLFDCVLDEENPVNFMMPTTIVMESVHERLNDVCKGLIKLSMVLETNDPQTNYHFSLAYGQHLIPDVESMVRVFFEIRESFAEQMVLEKGRNKRSN